jgi:tetratricopeptide (TPR) repeat protein
MVENLSIGTVFYTKSDTDYTLYKVLKTSATEILAAVYWPSVQLPTATNLATFELQAACLAFPLTTFESIFLVVQQAITTIEEEERAQFERIRSGIQQRENEFQRLLQAGQTAVKEGEYASAILLLTEAAPFAKYNREIYELRGKSYFHLGNFREALVDLSYAIDQGQTGTEITEYVTQIHAQLKGN